MEPDKTLRVDPAVMQGFAAALGGAAEGLRNQLAELVGHAGVCYHGQDSVSARALGGVCDG